MEENKNLPIEEKNSDKEEVLTEKNFWEEELAPGKEISEADEIAQMHRQNKKKKKRRRIILISVIAAVVIIAIVVGVLLLQRKVTRTFAGDSSDSVLSAEVTRGSISTTVSGSGTLAYGDISDVSCSSSLEIDEFLVSAGDEVSKGDILATVTDYSLMSAMSAAQEAIDTLDDEIEEAEDEAVSSTISAGVSGRVKAIYAEKGESVTSVMYDHGALMLISLDGYMSLEIEDTSLEAGDTVTVKTSDGSSYTGTVNRVSPDGTKILITDNGTTLGDLATVTDSSGKELGEGYLEVNSPLSVTGYAGTVVAINVSVNQKVSSGTSLFTLNDTSITATYDELVEQRKEAKDLLSDLVEIYENGGITSPIDGVVSSVLSSDSSDSAGSAAALSGAQASSTSVSSDYTTIAVVSENTSMTVAISVDETDILALSEGQEAFVTVDSLGDETYLGTVTSVDKTAQSSSGVTTYSAEITIDRAENMLSGMSASVVITIEGVEDALLIPVAALHQTSSTSYVYTSYDEASGEFSGMVEVTSGLSNDTYVEVTSGLKEGDTVYYNESENTTFFFDGGGVQYEIGGDGDGVYSFTFPVDEGDFGGDMGGGAGGGDMPDIGGTRP